jgi:hypothetical protein
MKKVLVAAIAAVVSGSSAAAITGLVDSTTQTFVPDADLRYAPLSHATSHRTGGGDPVSLDATQITTGQIPDERVANDITAGQLAVNPTACPGGQFVEDIAADGTLSCATPPAGGSTTFDGGTYTEVTFGTNVTLVDDGDGTATVNVSAGTATLGDGDYGDVVVSGSGTVMTIDSGVVEAAEVPVALSPTNYSAATGDVEAHLVGINTALGSAGGGGPTFNGGTVTDVAAGSNISFADDGDGTITLNVSAGTATLGDGDYGDVTVSGGGASILIDPGVVDVANLASADFGDFTCNGTVCTLDASYLTVETDPVFAAEDTLVELETRIGAALLESADIAAGAITPATGNLDLTGTNGQLLVIDAVGNVVPATVEDAAYTRILNPNAGTIQSWWRNPTSWTAAAVEIWCESDQTVNLDVQVDDGTPADIIGTDITCAPGGVSQTVLGGDTLIETDETLDIVITSVAGAPTWVALQVKVEYQ